MVVPYGFGVGDFVAVGTLAWNVYKSCRAAPDSFSNISIEVLSLHAVLKEADETIFKSPPPPESQMRLKTIGDGCQCVLSDLQALVDKYESLGTQSKRTWDRMKWGAENIVEIRSRLISNTTLLTAYISTSQTRVEQKLDKLIKDFQQSKRAPSVISLQTVDSLDPADKEAWRTIRKELEDIGISVAAFDANKDFIFEWFSNAVETGAFQEQPAPSPPASVHSLDVLSSTSSLSSSVVERSSKETVRSDTDPAKESGAETKATGNYTIVQKKGAGNGTDAAAEPHARIIPTKVPRVAALIAILSRPKRRLDDAVERRDIDGIKKIVTNPATSRLIDKPALTNALLHTITHTLLYEFNTTSNEPCALLIEAGADVNDHSRINREHPLTKAVCSSNRDLVAFLLDRGADVNYQSGDGTCYSSALRAAIQTNNEAMITLLSQRGADINAVQEVPKGRLGYPTGIHQASAGSSASVVDSLINLGADFNSSQRGFGTPLVSAICNRSVSTAEFLIQKGANINEVPVQFHSNFRIPFEKRFRSIIDIAILVSSPELVKLLLDNGLVTDWHEIYEFAKERSSHPNEIDRYGFAITNRKRSGDARQVLQLIKAHIDYIYCTV